MNSDIEISQERINDAKSKLQSLNLMDIEVYSAKDSFKNDENLKQKNQASAFFDNFDSFGKSNLDRIIMEGKSKEKNPSELIISEPADKRNFNFDYRKFDEIFKFFKEK